MRILGAFLVSILLCSSVAQAQPKGALSVSDVQGAGLTSPFEGQTVSLLDAVVTAVLEEGFFVQALSTADGDPATSDGMFVIETDAAVAVGDLVALEGEVVELDGVTSLDATSIVVAGSGDFPEPAVWNFATPSPLPADPYLDFERHEGMLVGVPSGVVVAPNATSFDEPVGDIKAVALPQRPLREAGIVFPGFPDLPVWDGNPHIFEIDIDALGQANQQVVAGATFSASGILTFDDGEPEIYAFGFFLTEPEELPDTFRERRYRELIAVSANVDNFFNDQDEANGVPVLTLAEFETRRAKLVLWLRDVLHDPDVIAFQQTEHAALESLATAIADAGGPAYGVWVLAGNDNSQGNLGYLVRQDSMSVTGLSQFGAALQESVNSTPLFPQPPLILEANFIGAPEPFALTFVNVQLNGLELVDDSVQGEFARNLRDEQGTELAGFLQARQTDTPDERIFVLGDFNAFEFTDGYVDVLGQVSGAPDPLGSLVPATDIVDPDFTVETLEIPAADRYSVILEDGTSAAVDHLLTSSEADPLVIDIAYAHGNADAPPSYAEDDSIPLRASDHDFLVVYIGTAINVIVDSIADTGNFDLSQGNIELREAIEVVVPTGTVTFAPELFAGGTQTVALNPALGHLAINKSLRIVGPGREDLVVSGSDAVRVFQITDGDVLNQIDVFIADLTIADGATQPEEGGGINNFESLELLRVTVRDSASPVGGGIMNQNALVMTDCVVRDCVGESRGGGIANLFFTRLEMSGCQILDNATLSADGAGLHIESFGISSVAITDSTIAGNAAGGDGGGLWSNGQVSIANSTISDNSALGSGGGMFDQGVGVFALSMVNVTIGYNLADANADGEGDGGGLYSRFAGGELVNCLVVGNEDTPENAGPGTRHPDISGALESSAYNVIGAAAGTVNLDDTDTVLSLAGITAATDVLHPDLQDNGGGTLTHALASGSPAIDAGNAALALHPETLVPLLTDQRGLGFPRMLAEDIDAGALEAAPDAISPTLTISQGPEQADPANTLPIVFDLQFSEAVTGLEEADIEVAGIDGATFTLTGGGSLWHVNIITAPTDGVITVDVGAGVAADPFGNLNEAAEIVDNAVTIERDVPVIALLGASEIVLECGAGFVDPGATAADPTEGDLSQSIVVSGSVDAGSVGTYVLAYNVSDSVGNAADVVTRTIDVIDTTPPVLVLNGPAELQVACGSNYPEAGGGASDACDGNITGAIEIDASAVDTSTPGLYEVQYSVTDNSGLSATATRMVRVVGSAVCSSNHSADLDGDGVFDLEELLRIIQFYNSFEYHCDALEDDGFAPGPGAQDCLPHSSDYDPQDWVISLSELLRAIQIFNMGGYELCPNEQSEDGFCTTGP